MNIILIRFSSMGDVLLQTSFIKWIKLNNPHFRINFVTSKEFVPLLQSNPDIDNIIPFERKDGIKGLVKLGSFIQNDLKADIIFDLHGTLRARFLKMICFKSNFISLDKFTLERSILIKFKLNLLKKKESIHQRIINDFQFLFKKSKKLDTKPNTYLQNINNQKLNTIIISPVASFENKKWPLNYYKKLLQLILEDPEFDHYNVKILGGPDDDYCQQMMIQNMRVEYLQGQLNLDKTFDFINNAKLTITNDTGMAHISESLNTPVFSFFGPTVKEFGFGPHLELSKVFEVNLSCRPCSATGSGKCIQKELLCMNQILPEDVFDYLKKWPGL